MPDKAASQTALGVARVRAAHRLLDEPPWLLDDPAAIELLDTGTRDWILSNADGFRAADKRALRAHVLLRSRFAEDQLNASLQRGVSRYLVLGAGFDTFAFRQPDWARALEIVEVDHPESQQMKRNALDRSNLDLPGNLRFLSVDFELDTLLEALEQIGGSSETPTFCSSLGLSVYLSDTANRAIFSSVASLPAGSELVLAFAPTGITPPWGNVPHNAAEPNVHTFSVDELDEVLHSSGFKHVRFLTPDDARSRYFDKLAAGLPAPEHTTLLSAVV